ncbi:hypothetical protein EW026_g6948 [Hermanssonia centrifuga]|uniref:Ubiquitin-like domain-containing protein n=1 Tax=Hermanssonia centrifuga TaxID=98765 RepID=A0A4S4K9F8_9APHY|nr:hypothetical protein EW026_g6948 [Hermanssonia centrifuga]
MSAIELNVSHRGTTYPLSLLPDSTFDALQARLEELTSVPPSNQKLLYKGKKPIFGDETIIDAGFKSGMKVQMLGSTAEEIGELRNVEDEHQRKERILRERAQKPQTKLRNTSSPSKPSDLRYRFHSIEPLLHLPNPPAATALLNRLANDPAIRHVMQKHEFVVAVLTELAPHEQPQLLGLNMNAGQAIKLRLRTNDYEGFRPYGEFKELNSQLNREVAEFERAATEGTHYLSSTAGDIYQPSSQLEAEAQTYVLGGTSHTPVASESREERRRRLLDATMNRLRKEEEELEQSCGTAGPSANH